jgi:hypothetical protein
MKAAMSGQQQQQDGTFSHATLRKVTQNKSGIDEQINIKE